jgi:multicomponent Na+:H+ antiporter subunit D
VAKGALFLVAGKVPSRDLSVWGVQPLAPALGLPLLVGALSIAGAPPLLGYYTKASLETLPPTGIPGLPVHVLVWLLPLLMVGTAAVYARLCWLPLGAGWQVPAPGGLLLALVLLLVGLVGPLLPGGSPFPSTAALGKGLAVLAAGAGVEALRRGLARPVTALGFRRRLRLPSLESLVDLLGALAVVGAGLQLLLLRLQPLSAELLAVEAACLG